MSIGALLLLLITACTQLSLDVFSTGKLAQAKFNVPESGDIVQMIEKLHSSHRNIRDEAKRKLLVTAKESSSRRSQIIRALIGVLEKPETSSGTWYDAAELLGELRATEAIDILVQHLDYNDGVVGLSAAHFPALKAVMKIGEAAVPKLVKALFESPPSIRENAARALGQIGGDQAKEALERALTTETDERVRRDIRIALSNRRSDRD